MFLWDYILTFQMEVDLVSMEIKVEFHEGTIQLSALFAVC